ncbi:MAG: methylated-DNA--[protein]-cysteine S-methyltransferase [Armatimonadota bacterium]
MGLIGQDNLLSHTLKPALSREEALAAIKSIAYDAEEDNAVFGNLPELVSGYFEGDRVDFRSIKIDLSHYGEFHARVILAAREISYGSATTYAELAKMAGSKKAAQAAGQAMAKNRTPIIVPCHRVICSEGGIGGFAWGRTWKIKLLRLEGCTYLKDVDYNSGVGNA